MCCYKNTSGKIDVSEKVIENTIELTKELMKKYNIPIQNVIRHYDVTGKNCPAPFVEYPNRWIDFLNRLKEPVKNKYNQGEYIEVNIPVQLTGAYEGDNALVDTDGYQYWIHKSVIKDGQIIARAQIAYVEPTRCLIQIFDKQFWCENKYIIKKL